MANASLRWIAAVCMVATVANCPLAAQMGTPVDWRVDAQSLALAKSAGGDNSSRVDGGHAAMRALAVHDFRTLALPPARPQAAQGSAGPRRITKVALVVVGIAVVGTGAYLVASHPRGWLFSPVRTNPGTGTTTIDNPKCLDYNPFAATGGPETRCTPIERNLGFGLMAGGVVPIVAAFRR